LLLTLCAAHTLWTAFQKSFSIDEFQYAHAAWALAHGQIVYRDFFEVHFPLLYQLLAPLMAGYNVPPDRIMLLRYAMGPIVLATGWSLWRINRSQGMWVALWGPVLLFSSQPYVAMATEIRPDSLATMLYF
jgi:hypothetical protein